VIRRHQLAVAPRITLASLARAAFSNRRVNATLAETLQRDFHASTGVLTDSGTSALVLALRLLMPRGGIVGLPGYGCVDITSAVQFAGVRARLYDVDPTTLSPDLDSVAALLKRGVDAILVAHYYGYPADVPAVRALAAQWGVPILEDAAQAAGGSLEGARLGSLGDVSILSFGRGKGLFGGRGGALLIRSGLWSAGLDEQFLSATRLGFVEWCSAAAQWGLGRPRLYGIPASIPRLRLGEMVYHPAHEPRALSFAAASLVLTALRNEPRELRSRRHTANRLCSLSRNADGLSDVKPVGGACAGYLRFAVLDRSKSRTSASRLGVMRGYPRTLQEQPELVPRLIPGEPPTPGAALLRDALFTLPTHAFVSAQDLVALGDWMHRDMERDVLSYSATTDGLVVGGEDLCEEISTDG
jgi:dTDP-4-amino-4,6-dideoxygalactose transaminase